MGQAFRAEDPFWSKMRTASPSCTLEHFELRRVEVGGTQAHTQTYKDAGGYDEMGTVGAE